MAKTPDEESRLGDHLASETLDAEKQRLIILLVISGALAIFSFGSTQVFQ